MAGLVLDQGEVAGAVEAVGAEDHEHVREARDADPLVGLEAVLLPPLGEVEAVAAPHRVGRHVALLEDLEAGREDQHVDLVLAVLGAHAGGRERLDRRRSRE